MVNFLFELICRETSIRIFADVFADYNIAKSGLQIRGRWANTLDVIFP